MQMGLRRLFHELAIKRIQNIVIRLRMKAYLKRVKILAEKESKTNKRKLRKRRARTEDPQ